MEYILALFAIIGSAVYFIFSGTPTAPIEQSGGVSATSSVSLASTTTRENKKIETPAKSPATSIPKPVLPTVSKKPSVSPAVVPTPTPVQQAATPAATPTQQPATGSTGGGQVHSEPPTQTSAQNGQTDSRGGPVISESELALDIHSRINAERTAQGLSSLSWDPSLAVIATAHSKDMGTNLFFSHTNPAGENFSERYARGGYTCAVQVGNTIYGGGENLFQNNRYDSYTVTGSVTEYDWNSQAELAASTVAGWMNSPGHRKNILTDHFGKQGIGIFFASNDQIYITQNFC